MRHAAMQVLRRLPRQPVGSSFRLAIKPRQVVDHLQQLLTAHLLGVTPQPLHEHLCLQARFDHGFEAWMQKR